VFLTVSLIAPERADDAAVRAYVDAAVRRWCEHVEPLPPWAPDGPGDPMFDLDPETVSVTIDTRRSR
jgi:hypothetical protein